MVFWNTSCVSCVEQVQASSLSSECCFHHTPESPDPLTHILYQQPDTESLPDGGACLLLAKLYMNFSSSCPVNFPISCFFFSPPHNQVALFHYLEMGRRSSTLSWRWSSFQGFRRTKKLRCALVAKCACSNKKIPISWCFLKIFHREGRK